MHVCWQAISKPSRRSCSGTGAGVGVAATAGVGVAATASEAGDAANAGVGVAAIAGRLGTPAGLLETRRTSAIWCLLQTASTPVSFPRWSPTGSPWEIDSTQSSGTGRLNSRKLFPPGIPTSKLAGSGWDKSRGNGGHSSSALSLNFASDAAKPAAGNGEAASSSSLNLESNEAKGAAA